MIKIIKLTTYLGLFSALLIGCAQTPNNVVLTVAQGQCVTSLYPGYESQATLYSSAFPMNGTLPGTSPYCAAVTITNNNSGQNANNIQIYQSGLYVSFPSLANGAGVTSATSMVDFNAAGIPQSSFSYTQQQLFNLNLFDPKNCVTTQGANVQTINANGGNCTFYLQLSGESMPIGVYPISLTLNYTNGNTNYSTTTNINQRANLYLGGIFSSNIAITNAGTTSPTANSIISANSPEQYGVTALTRDPYGMVYSGDILGNVYKYNGTTNSSWASISGLPSVGQSPVAALVTDSNANLYVVNNAGQVSQVTPSLAVNSLGSIPVTVDHPPTSMQVFSGTSLLISSGSDVYACNLASISVNSCGSTPYAPAPNGESINQMIATNTLTIATTQNAYQYSGAGWTPIASGLIGNDIQSMAQFINSSTGTTWYAGITQTESSNSSIYSETNGAAFAPLLSSSNAIVSGGVSQVVTDAAQGLFVSGLALSSSDFSGQTYLAYTASNYLGVLPATPWVAISGIGGGAVRTLQTASQLTSY
jgi:hypothetical protein